MIAVPRWVRAPFGAARTAAVWAAAIALATAAPAQETELEKAIAELQRQNDEFAVRIAELERGQLESMMFDDADEDIGLVARYEDIVATFQLFADVGVRYENPEDPGDSHTEFDFGLLDFVINAQIGDRFRILSETVIDPDGDGGTSLSQERLWGMWTFGDLLYAKLGTEHTPVSRWNQLYHHGRWLETSVSRPLLAQFESSGGVLPLHRTGLELGGVLVGEAGKLEYTAAIANGRGPEPSDKQPNQDRSEGKQFGIELAVSPSAIADLRVGGAVLFDEIPEDPNVLAADRARTMRERIGTGNVAWSSGDWSALGEIAFIEHEGRVSGETWLHDTGYVQLELRTGDWTPFTRFDYRNMERGDPFYASFDRDLDQWRQVFGVRYDAHPNIAIKFEIGLGEAELRDATGGGVDEQSLVMAGFQVSWTL